MGRHSIPVPDDFAQLLQTTGVDRLKRHYRVASGTIQRWVAAVGGTPRPHCRPVPDDFAEVVGTLKTKEAVRNHYAAHRTTIARWIMESGVAFSKPKSSLKPVPDGFASLAPTMSQFDLSQHFGVSRALVARWLGETGVKSRGLMKDEAKVRAAPPSSRVVRTGWRDKAHHDDLRQSTLYTIAADTLRRERFVVHRCDERGRYAEKGEFWRVGNVVCTPAELLERADKYQRRAA